MATKIAVHNENASDVRTMFSRGLKISHFSELFLISGRGAIGPAAQLRYPGDPIAQTRYIFDDLKAFLAQAGFFCEIFVLYEPAGFLHKGKLIEEAGCPQRTLETEVRTLQEYQEPHR